VPSSSVYSSITPTLAKLEASLVELAGLGESMIAAIEGGDDARLIAAVQMARRLRAGLTGKVPALAAGGPPPPAAVERLRQLVAAAHMTEQIADRWLARPLPPDRELLQMTDGEVFLADAMLPGVWDFERDLVVVVGPGMGPVATALRELGQARILWYGGGSERVTGVFPVEHLDEVAAAVRGFGFETPERLAVRALDPEQGPLCGQIAARVKTALSDRRIQRNTIQTFNRTWLEQGLANLDSLCRWPSVAALDGALAGKPLVIIAPGPSLARNIHLLAELKGKAVLLAVSHALTALTRAGITPDFALAVDPQDLRYHFASTPLDGLAAVINAATVHPELYRLGARNYLTLSANGVLDDWLYDLVGDGAVVAGGGSVATTAFALAQRWGCDPIAVVGLDLSFPGGQYYIETSCDGQARAVVSGDGRSVSVEGWSPDFHRMKVGSRSQLRSERVVELPGWHGAPVPTSFMFALFHRWFEERVRREPGPALFNCTEGGARIEGMEHVPLAVLVARVADSSVDPAAAVARAVAERGLGERRRYTAYRLDRLVVALRRCRALARRCRRLADRQGKSSAAALTRAESELVQALAPLELLSMMAQAQIGDALNTARDVASVEEAVAASSRLFGHLDQAAAWMVPRVLEAQRAFARAQPTAGS
jgi:hypothetical protein